MTNKKILSVFILVTVLISCSKPPREQQHNVTALAVQDWKLDVENTLQLFGHRNWIVIADGAYPQQSNQAIKTITIDTDQLEAVEFVAQLIDKATHIDANIFVDKELTYITEKDAKGVESYRSKLKNILAGRRVKTMLHDDIIYELDATAKLFKVLIIKTDLAIPYTSVFFQLECGYWNAEAEKNLRAVLKKMRK